MLPREHAAGPDGLAAGTLVYDDRTDLTLEWQRAIAASKARSDR